MHDISQSAGFPLALIDNDLRIADGITSNPPKNRTLADLLPFLLFESASSVADPIYRVYQDVRPVDAPRGPLHYDLTVIYPGLIKFSSGEKEFTHTAGHYHLANGPKTYPEIYEVVSGHGRWLIQKPSTDDPRTILEAYLIEAALGEKVLIPPGFGHTMINAEKEPLVASNVVLSGFTYDYDSYKAQKGACYRFLEHHDDGLIEIKANPMYHTLPGLKKLKPKKDWFKGYFDPLWKTFSAHPEDLKFISDAETYSPQFFSIERANQEII